VEDYRALKERIEALEAEHDIPSNRVLYMALPPGAFPGVVENLGAVGLDRCSGWTRLVVEKPFGTDLGSARGLNRLIHDHFTEEQVYRIDHYLGKETVQNLLVFRFANQLFESVWNRDRIEAVHVTVAEDIGLGGRAGYYDRSGAVRDMVQNHIAQLLSLTAMEVPGSLDADAIRNEKVKVLRSARPFSPDDVVFGRYEAGEVRGERAVGYLDEEGVEDDSTTETYAALRLNIDNWRWQGVPFYLRTGKRLARRLTQIVVTFRTPPVALFSTEKECPIHANVLSMTLQPDEGFSLAFEVKPPGDEIQLETEELAFKYADAFEPLPEAYETLLLDIVQGDQTLFVRADEVEASWELFQPVLDMGAPVHGYPAGSWGPAQADGLLKGLLHTWPERHRGDD
jgi:glucose-6-phosphate 1-dehydrogenase